MDEETTPISKLNLWVVLYLAMALFWVGMAYMELSGKELGNFLPVSSQEEKPVIEGSVA